MNKREQQPRNFLGDYRATYNNKSLVSINEAEVKTLIDRYSQNGYIVVSASRGYEEFYLDPNNPHDRQQFNDRYNGMLNAIQSSGFTWTPCYGDFIENPGTDHEEHVYEKAVIVFNVKRGRKEGDIEELYNLGVTISSKFNQDNFLFKAPNESPKYISKNGNVDLEFSDDVSFNDACQRYFIDLHKSTHRHGLNFSYVESYINPSPCNVNEATSRVVKGEVFGKIW